MQRPMAAAGNTVRYQSIPGSRMWVQLIAWRSQVKVKVAQLCPTVCNPMDYTVHGILQARILEWVQPFPSPGAHPTEGSIPGLPHCRRILYQLSHGGSTRMLKWVAYPFSTGSSRPRNRTANIKSLHSIPECVFVYVCVYRKRQINLLQGFGSHSQGIWQV